jgi:hypothetical protein
MRCSWHPTAHAGALNNCHAQPMWKTVALAQHQGDLVANGLLAGHASHWHRTFSLDEVGEIFTSNFSPSEVELWPSRRDRCPAIGQGCDPPFLFSRSSVRLEVGSSSVSEPWTEGGEIAVSGRGHAESVCRPSTEGGPASDHPRGHYIVSTEIVELTLAVSAGAADRHRAGVVA